MTHTTAKKKDGLGGMGMAPERHYTGTNRIADSYSAIQDEAKHSIGNNDEDYGDECSSSYASLSLRGGRDGKPDSKEGKEKRNDKKVMNIKQSHLLKMISAEGVIDNSN